MEDKQRQVVCLSRRTVRATFAPCASVRAAADEVLREGAACFRLCPERERSFVRTPWQGPAVAFRPNWINSTAAFLSPCGSTNTPSRRAATDTSRLPAITPRRTIYQGHCFKQIHRRTLKRGFALADARRRRSQ